MRDIIIGRSEDDIEEYGKKGSIFIGKQYIKMERTVSLSNKIFLDMLRTHVLFVCGKRGSGKSYTMGVIAEGMAGLPKSIRNNLSVIMLDTMGVYWTMKYPNLKDKELLEEWDMKPEGEDNVKIFTPGGFFEEFQEKGVPTDYPFSIRTADLNASDWTTTFDVESNDPEGVLIERIIHQLQEEIEQGEREDYGIREIVEKIKKNEESKNFVKNAAENHFRKAEDWGIFSKEGTSLEDLAVRGQVTVLDLSCYSNMENSMEIKSLVIGLVSQKLFDKRMEARKWEEFADVNKQVNYLSGDEGKEEDFPLVWLVIDEAHEFLPKGGGTLSTTPLVTVLREGRQPGISLILASQQPGKIHTDVMTQSDTILSHRITAKIDTDALGMLMQSYMREGIDELLEDLPERQGAAMILDDNNERLFPMQVRPRFTWHGGEAPTALKKEKDLFNF